jgi:4'-phosphopantetheinyl transferase
MKRIEKNAKNLSGLSESVVHVWQFRIDEAGRAAPGVLASKLSTDELKRAENFRVREAARQFVVCRAVLRIILGRYLGIPAEDVCFAYSDKGKPYLRDSTSRISFNLSHSENICMVGLSVQAMLGIDVEQIQYGPDYEEVASATLSAEEIANLEGATHPDHRTEVFFECWTRREACMKASGEGLSGQSRGVLLNPGWTILNFSPYPGYSAAIALSKRPVQLDLWHWRPSGISFVDRLCDL